MIVCLNRLSLDSVILKRNDDHLSAVISWLPSGSSFSLLFRASTDGNSSQSFHSYCDNKGPTLVVAKSETCIGGAFTSQSWTSREFAFVVFELEVTTVTLLIISNKKNVCLLSKMYN